MKTVASPDVTVEEAVEQIDIGKSEKPYLKIDRGEGYLHLNEISVWCSLLRK